MPKELVSVLLLSTVGLGVVLAGRLLSLRRGRVGRRVAAVRVLRNSSTEARLVCALWVLARQVILRRTIATEASTSTQTGLLLTLARLLLLLLTVVVRAVVVRGTTLLISRVVGRILVRGRAVGTTGLLALRLRVRWLLLALESIEVRLRSGWLLVIEGLLRESGLLLLLLLGSRLAEAAELVGSGLSRGLRRGGWDRRGELAKVSCLFLGSQVTTYLAKRVAERQAQQVGLLDKH